MVDTPRTPLCLPVLVGRDRGLEQLSQARRTAQQGRGQFVSICQQFVLGRVRIRRCSQTCRENQRPLS